MHGTVPGGWGMIGFVRQWFRNLSLTSKLIYVFSLPAVFLIAITLVTVSAVREFLSADLLVQQSERIMFQATHHLELLYATQDGFRGYVLTSDPSFLPPLRQSMDDLREAGVKLARLVEDAPSRSQVGLVARINEITGQYLEEITDAFYRMQHEEPTAGLSYIKSGKGPARGEAIRSLINQFEAEVDRIQQARLRNAESKRVVLFWAILGGALGTLLVTGCGVMIVARSVAGPVEGLSRTAQRISAGEDAVFPEVERRDEVGILSRSLADMNARVRAQVLRLVESEGQLRTLNQSLAASEARYRSLVEQVPVGIYTTVGLTWTFANRVQVELMGLPPHAGPSFNDWATALHPDDQERVVVDFKDAVERRLPFEASFRYLQRGGLVRHVLSRGVPVGPASPEGTPYLCLDLDVTQREEMRERLVSSERLAALTRMATGIAHDLRTPLVGIERGLQGLRFAAEGRLPSDAQELLGDLYGAARMAVGIVQDIMDLYRHAHGELHLSYTRFALGDLVRDVVELMKPEMLDRHLTSVVHAQPVAISADRRRLWRVMANLLDNAIKNSPMGGCIRVTVSAAGDEPRRLAVVTIEDEGKGLDPLALQALFEANRPASAPSREGTGLGLYLCRFVIGAHHGTLTAENRAEGGARVVVRIPAEVELGDQSLAR